MYSLPLNFFSCDSPGLGAMPFHAYLSWLRFFFGFWIARRLVVFRSLGSLGVLLQLQLLELALHSDELQLFLGLLAPILFVVFNDGLVLFKSDLHELLIGEVDGPVKVVVLLARDS
jgi:hypothetical protein